MKKKFILMLFLSSCTLSESQIEKFPPETTFGLSYKIYNQENNYMGTMTEFKTKGGNTCILEYNHNNIFCFESQKNEY